MSGNAPNTRNWKAKEMPDFVGRNYRLTVSGEVEIVGTGTTAKLTKHQPQGINPAILLLDLDINSPGGIQGQIARFVKVTYEEKTSGNQYTEVDILFEGNIIARLKVDHPKTAAKKKPAKKTAEKKKPAKKKAAKKSAKK
jgi:hypothetical protein